MHPGYFHVQFCNLLLLSFAPLHCNKCSHNLLLQQLPAAGTIFHNNPACDHPLAEFYVALQATSRKASQLVRANLPLPHIRTLQAEETTTIGGS